MGLTRNNLNSGNPGRFYGAAQGSFAFGMGNIIQNAAVFGSIVSIPQGYNNQNAIRMTVKTGGNISSRFRVDAAIIASLTAKGNLSGLLDIEAFLVANGNVGLNGYANFDGEFDMVGIVSAIGFMQANMDLIARPSANDIAQEVWNSRITAFQSAGTLGKSLSSAESAAKLGAALSA